MIKIGVIGETFAHEYVYPLYYNGYDREKLKKCPKNWVSGIVEEKPDTPQIDDAKVTKIWNPDYNIARDVADVFNIKEIPKSLDEMKKDIDAIMILEMKGNRHLDLAKPFIESGIPCFIDKPLAYSVSDAKEIIEIANKYNTLIMSCSGIRFSEEIFNLVEQKDEIGEIKFAIASGPGYEDLFDYGVHVVEMFYAFFGQGIESVQFIGENNMAGTIDIARIQYPDGKIIILQISKTIAWEYHFILFGDKMTKVTQIKNSYVYFKNTAQKFITMINTGKLQIPLEETLEIMKVLETIKKYAKTGEIVYINKDNCSLNE